MALPPNPASPHPTAVRLKLAFSHGGGEVFCVHVLPLLESSKNGRGGKHFIAAYTTERFFLSLLAQTNIDPIQYALIVRSIAGMAPSPGTLACCDEVSLNDDQLLVLLNGAIESRKASNPRLSILQNNA